MTCRHVEEDILAIFVMITTAWYFLFFCRGFKLTGPFVIMIYRMMAADLLRFGIIYVIFVMGFAQCKEIFLFSKRYWNYSHPLVNMIFCNVISYNVKIFSETFIT